MTRDQVDGILDQWHRERPDLDVSGMAVIGRVSRLAVALGVELRRVFAQHGLEEWEFDLLATLRRHGEPFRLTAGQLVASSMVTGGAVTNRIDRLAARGYVRRERDEEDGRVVWVALTDEGRRVVDATLPHHAANELRMIQSLSPSERDQLVALVRKLHAGVAAAD
ncbi:MarR family transcriptional regulator [Demequina sp.]|uniref:MarR family winged helix-turn-helix transcriptional regulator n=1 Tax=Demequina sp. TaxID=2050685 RepID=UPI0025EE8B19|nr:MarR family transcriptional regulator [Demequina sp.]